MQVVPRWKEIFFRTELKCYTQKYSTSFQDLGRPVTKALLRSLLCEPSGKVAALHESLLLIMPQQAGVTEMRSCLHCRFAAEQTCCTYLITV